jgi:two-component system cell cycle sensor histidine kinase/response regulator CckA
MSGAAKAESRNGTSSSLTAQRDQEFIYRALFEGASIGIALCALDGHILQSNLALAGMLGYGQDELTQMNLGALSASDATQVSDSIQHLIAGIQVSVRQESQCPRKDGSCFRGRWTPSVVRDSDRDPSFLVGLLEDATEDQRAAKESREAEQMEVIGRLAGGIAHDFNNVLTGVLLYCDLLSDGINPSSPLLQHVQEIRLAGEQGAALTQQFLAIARKQVPQLRPLSVNDIVDSTKNLLRRLIGEQIELVVALSPKLRTVLADQAQLQQVLLNLVLNARDAIPNGGRITVSTHAKRRVNGTPPTVSLLVEDTGCGMNKETRAHLFEPFFTTKISGHGTGLGMVTVQRIVSEAGGTIKIDSEPGHGTRIEVSFPALPSVSHARQLATRPSTAETILLVDDHASARRFIQRVLHHAGYRVLPASNGRQAMKIFSESARDISLLVADWMMPGMTGCELTEQLRHQKPGLKVLLISGYHEPGSGSPHRLRGTDSEAIRGQRSAGAHPRSL